MSLSSSEKKFCKGRAMTEILAVIVIASTLFLGTVGLIGYMVAMSKATAIQKEANARASSIMTSPSLSRSHVGDALAMLGFSEKSSDLFWGAYRRSETSFAVTVKPVSKLVCELIKRQDWSFLAEMDINNVPVDKAFCQFGENAFTFVYGTAKKREPVEHDTCLENEVPCDSNCCSVGQDCCAGECFTPCTGSGMTGARDAFTCDCICNEQNGFQRLAEAEKCICLEYLVQNDEDPSYCVECNETADCLGSCQECINHICSPSHCCAETETPCGNDPDNCCTQEETCCNDTCYKACDFKGATGNRNNNCECTCDIQKGFKLLPVEEVCLCQEGLVKLPNGEGCAQCNVDADCDGRGECMVCNEFHMCIKGSCCKENETLCGEKCCTPGDICCGDKECCSSVETCCNNQCYPECNFKNTSGHRDLTTCQCTCDVGKGFSEFPDAKGVCQCPEGWTRNTDSETGEEYCTPPCNPEDQKKPRTSCFADYEICSPGDVCCNGNPCSEVGYCCPDPKTLRCDKKYQKLVLPENPESQCAYCENRPISFSGVSDIKTDELIFFYFTREGQRLQLKYQDTGPGGGRVRPGKNCNNTNCTHNHVIKEVFIPEDYEVDFSTLLGSSCGEGCENVDIKAADQSVVYCRAGYIQIPRIIWRFTIYPKDWKKKK